MEVLKRSIGAATLMGIFTSAEARRVLKMEDYVALCAPRRDEIIDRHSNRIVITFRDLITVQPNYGGRLGGNSVLSQLISFVQRLDDAVRSSHLPF